MFLSPRMRLRPLAGLCRRLAVALEAGIDVRTVWGREAERAVGWTVRDRFARVAEAVQRGSSLGEALSATGEYFPRLFREMVGVGEQTGHLSEVFVQLADHYEGQLELRRTFLAAIAWPATQLSLAVLIVGFLIWIMGVIGQVTQRQVDPLGLGLVGNYGLAIYVVALAGVGTLGFFVVFAVRRELAGTRLLQHLLMRVPVLGGALRTLALARIAWSLHLTLNTEMDVRRALRLSVRSTQNAYFTDRLALMEAAIGEGNSIHDAFVRAGTYPCEFLDAIAVAEESGRLVESMGHLARLYREQARVAMGTINRLAGLAVWIAVAAIIIVLIFRLFAFYLGTIQGALDMR